jgi:hypothetical protein
LACIFTDLDAGRVGPVDGDAVTDMGRDNDRMLPLFLNLSDESGGHAADAFIGLSRPPERPESDYISST